MKGDKILARVKRVIIDYPEDMTEIQDAAMEILAKALVKRYPPNVINQIIEGLEKREQLDK